MRVSIGTSGWQYASWRGRFYPPRLPQREWLAYYAERFATVEVNNTFYRLPRPETFGAWAAGTPDDFEVVVKASRYLSHVRRLADPAEPVARLLEHAAPLGPKLGPVLLQLPPTMRAEPRRLDDTLAAFGSRARVAVEFRHGSWFAEEVYDVLASHGAALCLTDRANVRGPVRHTARWTFVRLHAGTASPRPCYGRRALDWWAARLADLAPHLDGAHVFLNNDERGCAVANARDLGLALDRRGIAHSRVPAAREIDLHYLS